MKKSIVVDFFIAIFTFIEICLTQINYKSVRSKVSLGTKWPSTTAFIIKSILNMLVLFLYHKHSLILL